MNFLKDLFFPNSTENNTKIGLAQFKKEKTKPINRDISITTKNIKLSDLMRRAS